MSGFRVTLGSTPKLSLLHCSSSICNLLCVEVLLISFWFDITYIVSDLVTSCIGFVICNCVFDPILHRVCNWVCAIGFCIVFTTVVRCSRLCAMGCSVDLRGARVLCCTELILAIFLVELFASWQRTKRSPWERVNQYISWCSWSLFLSFWTFYHIFEK